VSGYQLGNLYEYTLRGLAKSLGVSTGLIYKIETVFGLRSWGSRLPGKKSIYSEAQMNFFLKVICLNSQFFANLSDIKTLFEQEKEIKNFAELHFPAPRTRTNKGKNGMPSKEKVDVIKVFLIAGLYCPQEGIEFDRLKYGKDEVNAKKLDKLYEEYTAVFKQIADATHRRQEIIKMQINRMDEIATAKV